MTPHRCTCECEEDRLFGDVYKAEDVDTYIRELVDFVDNLRQTLDELSSHEQPHVIDLALDHIRDEATKILERYQ